MATVRSLGVEARDVPGFEYIRAEPDDRSEGGVRILVKLQDKTPIAFGIREFAQVIDAMREVHLAAASMVREDDPA